LIHDGTAESGHYYSFIFDRKQDVWWRFSDVNVSMEIEEVVFREAFGGQVASTKTAYSLIYINEFCKNQLESKTVAPFLMGKFMNINSDLRNRITMDNNAFSQQYERFMSNRTADAIRRRFQEKKRQVTDSKQTLEGMLHLPLTNIIFHLNFEKKTVFCDWVTLNQAVYDELGVDAGGLRALAEDKKNLVYRELETSFKPGFLSMSPKDEASLDVHKRAYKEEKRRYTIVAFALKTFSDDI
jgi:ubiquitin carboxyl-terminal hydrolase 25/28